MAFWVKRGTGDTNHDGVFDALGNAGDIVGYQSLFMDTDVLRVRVDEPGAGFALLDTTAQFTDTSSFHHVAFVVDRTADTATYYIDAVPEAPLDISPLTGGFSPDQDLWIGGFNDNATFGLDGALDDLRFYDHALTAQEVSALVQPGGGVIPEPSACAAWCLLAAVGAAFGWRRRRGP